MKVRVVGGVQTVLGEGPYWDPIDEVLYFIDIRASKLLRLDPRTEAVRSWDTPVQPAAISRTADDRLVVALGDGFYEFDPVQGSFAVIAKVHFDHDEEVLNDAKVDRQGRFVAGATNNQSGRPVAGIYSFDGRDVTKIGDGFSICNGPCWSPDGRTFYLGDTGPNLLYAFDYDVETGRLSNKRAFGDTSEVNGMPDGATVDSDGHVWWTFIKGDGDILVFNPDGTEYRRVSTGLRWMSSIQFGGDDYSTIYLTSLDPAANGIPETDPHPGGLFELPDTGVIGLPEPLAARI